MKITRCEDWCRRSFSHAVTAAGRPLITVLDDACSPLGMPFVPFVKCGSAAPSDARLVVSMTLSISCTSKPSNTLKMA